MELLPALIEIFNELPSLWVAVVFMFSLLVGTFLNVVIHRIPIMLEREWRAQAQEILRESPGAGHAEHVTLKADLQTDRPAGTEQRSPNNLVGPRSTCPNCGALIKASQNIPVLSYIQLGGKCASCGAKTSLRYPIVELVTALLSALVAWKFGFGWYTAAALVLTGCSRGASPAAPWWRSGARSSS